MYHSIEEQEIILKKLTYSNDVFKNKLNIRDNAELEETEKLLVAIKAIQLPYSSISKMDFDYKRLIATNKFLLEDLYEFAGNFREVDYYDLNLYGKYGNEVEFSNYYNIEKNLDTVFNNLNSFWDYYTDIEKMHLFSACVADLYLVHPFYRCNSTTLMLFSIDFAQEKLNLSIDPIKLINNYDIEKLLYNYQYDNISLIKAFIECDNSNNHFHDMFAEADNCIKNDIEL